MTGLLTLDLIHMQLVSPLCQEGMTRKRWLPSNLDTFNHLSITHQGDTLPDLTLFLCASSLRERYRERDADVKYGV